MTRTQTYVKGSANNPGNPSIFHPLGNREEDFYSLKFAQDFDENPGDFIEADRAVFVHIRKTAGSSFGRFLVNFFQVNEAIFVSHMISHDPDQWPDSLTAGKRLLCGHFLPDSISKSFPKSHFITLLRAPLSRMVSYYHHRMRTIGMTDETHRFPQHDLKMPRWPEFDSIDEFFQSKKFGDFPYFDNYVVRILGMEGDDWMSPDLEDHSFQSALERAKVRLREDYAFVGLTENYEESKKLFCRTFGIPDHFAEGEENFNLAPSKDQKKPLSVEIADELLKRNAYDVELYRYASELFEERLRISESNSYPFRKRRESLEPQSNLILVAGDNLIGSGLYSTETTAEGVSFRWSGNPSTVRIEFEAELAEGATLTIVIEALYAIDAEAWKALNIKIDKTDCPISRRKAERDRLIAVASVSVTNEMISRRDHLLEVTCPAMQASRSSGDEGDPRKLGLAIHRIEIS